VILACFCVAVFAWGFGFYGQSVYVAELQRLRGWPTSAITAATTTFYLSGAILMPFVGGALAYLGPRTILLCGAALLGGGACLFGGAFAPWQLFPAALVMAAGWAATTGTAIALTLALWFETRRGLAISLALNGASASGFLVAPVLVQLSAALGLRLALPVAAICGLVILTTVVLCCIGTPPLDNVAASMPAAHQDAHHHVGTRRAALRDRRFWSVTLPFALALLAQVGFIIHMVAFLRPALGPVGTGAAVSLTSAAAMLGRLALGLIIDRIPQRLASSASFATQALGLAAMLGYAFNLPEWGVSRETALYAGCVLFGLSVGNVITLPAILVQREFAAASFGVVVGLSSAIGQFTLALGPALFGLLHDMAGGYGAVLLVCITLQLAAGVLVLHRQQPDTAPGRRQPARL
jgi:MFS family permease